MPRMRKARAPLANALRKVLGAREPALSLSNLFDVVEAAGQACEAAKRVAIEKSHRPAVKRRTVARMKREREKAVKESIREAARERRQRGPGWRGTLMAKGLLPVWAEFLADFPDEPWPRDHALRGALVVLQRCGWVEPARPAVWNHPEGKVMNPHQGGARTARGGTWRLTGEGRIARRWVQWVRARRMMGWPAPMMGLQGRHVRAWLTGQDLAGVPEGVPMDKWGYRRGDVADDAWPWLAEAVRRLESGGAG